MVSRHLYDGDDGIRTHDPLLAGQVLSQLSYTPIFYTGYRSVLSLRFLLFLNELFSHLLTQN